MKKRTSILCFLLAFLGITFFSCKLKVEDTELFDKPGVILSGSQVSLIIPRMNKDTKYINVYRRDKQTGKDYNIGLLYHPTALENDNKNYCYIDTLIRENRSYDYRVRYRIDDKYYWSEWSDQIDVGTGQGFGDSVNLTFVANGAYWVYNKNDYTLTLTGSINPPNFTGYNATDYKPMIIVKSGEVSQAIPVSSLSSLNNVELRNILPSEFLDTDITIQGIVAQQTIYDDPNKPESTRLIKTIIWTELTEIDVQGAGSSKIIKVPAQTGNSGFDYSRKAK